MCVAAAIAGAAVVGGVASYAGSRSQANAARNASRTQANAEAANVAEARRQYDQTRADFAPYREAGVNALGRLNQASAGDFSAFTASPDYNFVRTEGTRDLGNTFATRGGAFSGNALRALAQYNQGLASTQFGNWWNRQQGLVNTGASGTSGTAAAGQAATTNIINANSAAGNALAGGILNAGNARASGYGGIADSFNQGIGNYLYYQRLQQMPQYSPVMDYGYGE